MKNVFFFLWIVDEETWKKGEELIKMMPYLKTNSEIRWKEIGGGDNFMLLCELLKGNAVPTKMLNLISDDKERKEKWKIMNANEINRLQYWNRGSKDDKWSIEM